MDESSRGGAQQTEVARPHVSVVSPVYGCGACIVELYTRLKAVLEPISPNFEIVLVNDASPDDAWNEIVRLAAQDHRLVGVGLARNFGQHYAITAGLDYARGDWVVVMDCDLQDRPEDIAKLYAKAQEGFDVVFGRRRQRKDTKMKRLQSKVFSWVLGYFSEVKTDSRIANFSIVSHKVVTYFRQVRETNRAYGLFIAWLGFKTAQIDVQHSERYAGETTYTFRKALRLAVDGIVAHSNKPLRLSIQVGFLFAAGALAFAVWIIAKYLIFGVKVEGWTSTIVSIYFVGGLLLWNLGIVGLYLGKVFDEVKARPLYVVRDELNVAVPHRLTPGGRRADDVD
ncbi:MAG: glycosyltransferase family 2 protein [Planctomycetia bacterium]